MNEYNINVDFSKGRISTNLKRLVQNDYNTTKLNFTFDKEGRVLFKMLYPDGTQYVDEIQNNELIFGKGVLNQEGIYEYEISLYSEDGRLTDYAVKSFEVRRELVDTDEIVEPDDRVPVLDSLINEVETIKQDVEDGKYNGEDGKDGKDGITPTIGKNGNWYIGDIDTGLPSQGPEGKPGSVKFIVANELPSENIEEDAIYMIPNSNSIEWNGDTTGKETFKYMNFLDFYKVSDQVLTQEEVLGGQLGVTDGSTGEIGYLEIKSNMLVTDIENVLLIGAEDTAGELPLAIIIKEPTTDFPQPAGTYFMVFPDGSGYTSSLSLSTSGENTYQEYIYVNGAWESLGGASVNIDLSNYATKEEVKAKTGELENLGTEDKSDLVNAINEVMNSSGGIKEITSSKVVLNDLDVGVYKVNGGLAIEYYSGSTTRITTGSRQYLMLVTGIENTRYAWIFENNNQIRFISKTGAKINYLNDFITSSSVLTKTNTSSYTPTSNYHPATKKYVDDNIASAITTTLGGAY